MSDRFFEGKVPVKLSKEPVPVLSCSDIVKCVVFALSVNPNVNVRFEVFDKNDVLN